MVKIKKLKLFIAKDLFNYLFQGRVSRLTNAVPRVAHNIFYSIDDLWFQCNLNFIDFRQLPVYIPQPCMGFKTRVAVTGIQ